MNDVNQYGAVQFPAQRVSLKEKLTEDWQVKSVEAICRLTGVESTDYHYRMRVNYELAKGNINKGDFEYIQSIYGQQSKGFPAKIRGYNIIHPKLELLKGEKATRVADYKVFAVDYDTISAVTEKKKELITQMLQQEFQQNAKELGLQLQQDDQGQPITPEFINKYMNYSYMDMKEETANKALRFLMKYCNVDDKFLDGWNDLLCAGVPVYWVGIVDNEPCLERINPENFFYGKGPDTKYIEDAEWARYEKFVPVSDIYDVYYDELTEDQRDRLDQWAMGGVQQFQRTVPSVVNLDELDTQNPFLQNARLTGQTNLIKVTHCVWKSKKKIGFLKYIDEQGEEQETIVDENYKSIKGSGDKIEWQWINEVWEGTKIGKDIYINVKPLPFQHTNVDNISKVKLPYIGAPYDALNTAIYSLVEVMKPLQYFYIEIMYRLQLAIAKSKGKVMLMDLAQLPASMGFNVEKWMYYLDAIGVAFINSFEEGQGKFENQRSAFNQFNSVDLNMANVINEYVELLEKIKNDIGELTGITKQREGQIETSELVGNTQRSVTQSAHITEPLFRHAAEIERRALAALIQVSKQAWIGGKKAQYIMSDLSRTILEIDGPEYADAEYGLFVSDSTQDTQDLQSLKALAQPALQNGATLSEIAALYMEKSLAGVKNKLEEIEEQIQQRAQQQQQAEAQQQEQEQQSTEAIEQAKLNLDKYKTDMDNQTKIYVAEINTYMADNTVDANGDGIPDVTEISDAAIKAQKTNADIVAQKLGLVQEDKRIALEEKAHKLEQDKHKLEQSRMDLEKKQMAQDKELKIKELKSKEKIAKQRPKTIKK